MPCMATRNELQQDEVDEHKKTGAVAGFFGFKVH